VPYRNWVVNSGNFSNILSTTWNQQGYYNDAIEAVYGNNYPTGCNTTALAQVLAYHEYPSACTNYSTLKSLWSKVDSVGWSGSYNWSIMKASSAIDYLSSLGKVEVSALMYEIAGGK
jgi:hypothetical protein